MMHNNKNIILHSLSLFIVLAFSFTAWVNHSFQANFWGPFLPGDFFGVPKSIEKNIGVYSTSKYGWDAQFYYYQSVDPFIQNPEISKHIDNPPYRYQKIGVPLIVFGISKILNFEITPPLLYHLIQIILVSIGFFYLLLWLKEIEHHYIYAYVWLFGAGTLNALFYGMPDMSADAVFIITLYYVYKKKLLPFIISATLLLLIREGYAVVVGSMFLYVLIFGSYFSSENKRFKEILLISIPLLFLLLWAYYIKLQLGVFSFKNVEGANLTDLPFMGYYKMMIEAIDIKNYREIILKSFSVATILVVLVYSIKNMKSSIIAFISVLYIILIVSLGSTVWLDYSGYMKAMGSIIIVAIFLLNTRYIQVLKLVLISYLLIGIYLNYKTKISNAPIYTQYIDVPELKIENLNSKIENLNSKIELDNSNIEKKINRNIIFIDFFKRELIEIDVKIFNNTEQTFHKVATGNVNGVYLSYQWIDNEGRVIVDGNRTPLEKDLEPKSHDFQKMKIIVPYNYKKYKLVLSFIQEGVQWAYKNNKDYGSYYEYEIK